MGWWGILGRGQDGGSIGYKDVGDALRLGDRAGGDLQGSRGEDEVAVPRCFADDLELSAHHLVRHLL